MLVNFMGSSLDPRTSLLAFFTAQYVCTSHSGVRVYHDFHLCNHQMHWVQPRFVVILGLKENLYMGDIWTGKMTAHETMKMSHVNIMQGEFVFFRRSYCPTHSLLHSLS